MLPLDSFLKLPFRRRPCIPNLPTPGCPSGLWDRFFFSKHSGSSRRFYLLGMPVDTVLYVGKARNLRRRLHSYRRQSRGVAFGDVSDCSIWRGALSGQTMVDEVCARTGARSCPRTGSRDSTEPASGRTQPRQ